MLPTPQNGEESGYAAIAVLDALIGLLLTKKLIEPSEIDALFPLITNKLLHEGSEASQRAARLFAKGVSTNK